MGELLHIDFVICKSTSHNRKRPMPALHAVIKESLIKIQQGFEIRPPHDIHDPLVVLRTGRAIAVRTVFLLAVRKIAAAYEDNTFSTAVDRVPDDLTELPVQLKRKRRQTDPDQLIAFISLIDKIEGYHSSVIKEFVHFPHRSRGETLPVAQILYRRDKLRGVLLLELNLRRTEPAEVAKGFLSG